MYLLNELDVLPLFLLLLLCGVGGWLMTLRWFDLEPHERSFVGFGIGLIFANWLANLLVRVVPISIVFWVSAAITLVLGVISAWPFDRTLLRVAFEVAAERDHAVLHRHADGGGLHRRVPGQLGLHLTLEVCIGLHRSVLSRFG